MPYNLTAISANGTTELGLIQAVNTELMLGYMGISFLIGITLVFFLCFFFSSRDTNKSVAATAFIAFTLAIFLRAMALIGNTALFVTLLCAAVALAFTSRRD